MISGGLIDIVSATNSVVHSIESMININSGKNDENGFSVDWNGALSRIKGELDMCFSYGMILH